MSKSVLQVYERYLVMIFSFLLFLFSWAITPLSLKRFFSNLIWWGFVAATIILSPLLGQLGLRCIRQLNEDCKPKDKKISDEIIVSVERKRKSLQDEIQCEIGSQPHSSLLVEVTRKSVVEDSYNATKSYFGRNYLKRVKLQISFINENGIDNGGLYREWFSEISKSFGSISPDPGEASSCLLFQFAGDSATLTLNPLLERNSALFANVTSAAMSVFNLSIFRPQSHTSTKLNSTQVKECASHFSHKYYPVNSKFILVPANLKQYRFIGYVMGKAISETQLLTCRFSPLFYKSVFKHPIEFEDMEFEDPMFYRNLMSLMDCDLSAADLGLYFTFDQPIADGSVETVELKHDGQLIAINNINKYEYITAVLEYKYIERLKPFVQSVQEGFEEIIPLSKMNQFTLSELQILLNGLPYLDPIDWENNTQYSGGYNYFSLQIVWFWKIVYRFSEEEKAKLLQFVTGSTCLPPKGFKYLLGFNGQVHLFTICRLRKEDARGKILHNCLPQSHTCYNILDIPEYESMDIMSSMILMAINNTSGFALR